MGSRSKRLQARLERFEHAFARTLIATASRLPGRLARGFVRMADGRRPHPEIEVLLKLMERQGIKGLSAATPELARARMRRSARVHAGMIVPVGAVRDLSFDGPGGKIGARLYSPKGPRRDTAPLLVFYHGGGFVCGDLETHDAPCRSLCRDLDVFVLSVDYRLAPEHPFPAAVEDACAALRYAQQNAASWGADPARIGVAGDSAGGNLATVATLQAVRSGEPQPVMQLLFYPTVDSTEERASVGLFGSGFFLTHADMQWFGAHYRGPFEDLADPRLSPLRASDLSGLPPTLIVTAGFDPLRDEGEEYAEALRAAGNRVEVVRCHDMIHGFINLGSLCRATQTELSRIAQQAHNLLWNPRRGAQQAAATQSAAVAE
jgi:acetyl esterase